MRISYGLLTQLALGDPQAANTMTQWEKLGNPLSAFTEAGKWEAHFTQAGGFSLRQAPPSDVSKRTPTLVGMQAIIIDSDGDPDGDD